MDRPNVILLSVDALRADRIGALGYGRPTTPVLDSLAREGIVCTQAISPGCFTQIVMPSLLTSTMPFDAGGYDHGARGRPDSLFKTFHDAGYHTTQLSTMPWVSRMFGYGEGVDCDEMLFTLNSVVGANAAKIKSTIPAYGRGEINRSEMLEAVEAVAQNMFGDIEAYCAFWKDRTADDRADLAEDRLITDGYDFNRILKIVSEHRAALAADREAYVERYLSEPPLPHEWIAGDWRFARRPGPMARLGWERASASIARPFAPSWATLHADRGKRMIDASALTRRIVRAIQARPQDRPFLIWGHFQDPHMPYCPGRGRSWHRETGRYLAALGHSPDIDPATALLGKPGSPEGWAAWCALYDAVVHYVDEQIGVVLAALEETGLADRTIVAVCADHGEELGEHGDAGHHFLCYEHNVRIPIIFAGPGVAQQRIESLTGLMDIAPTLAEFAGISRPEAWLGAPVTAPETAQRSHQILETFYGGDCLFEHRPLYMGVRTLTHKFLWKEYRDPRDGRTPDGPELFDLGADPGETQNLYAPDHPMVRELTPIIAARLAAIPEISDERIIDAFGDVGRAAVKRLRNGEETDAAE